MWKRVDELTASQEQMARDVDQLTAGQGQLTRELDEKEQQILGKNSEPLAQPSPTRRAR